MAALLLVPPHHMDKCKDQISDCQHTKNYTLLQAKNGEEIGSCHASIYNIATQLHCTDLFSQMAMRIRTAIGHLRTAE